MLTALLPVSTHTVRRGSVKVGVCPACTDKSIKVEQLKTITLKKITVKYHFIPTFIRPSSLKKTAASYAECENC